MKDWQWHYETAERLLDSLEDISFPISEYDRLKLQRAQVHAILATRHEEVTEE